VLQPTPEPSLARCSAGTGSDANAVDIGKPSDDAPLLVLRTPYAGFASISAQPTLVVWRNGDVLVARFVDKARGYQTQVGHIEPQAAFALVADVAQQLAGEPAFIEPHVSLSDAPMDRLFVFVDGKWRVWSVYGWWPAELEHPESLETEYQKFEAKKPSLQTLCKGNFEFNFEGPSECLAPRQPPPAKFAAVYRELIALQPVDARAFEPARYRIEFIEAWKNSRDVAWPAEFPVLPASLSPMRCSITEQNGDPCPFDFLPTENALAKQYADEVWRAPRSESPPQLRFAGAAWNFRILEEYRGERDIWQVAACAARVGVTQER